MKNMQDVQFLIVGGGIGGLTTALSVAKTGRTVHVLEQALEFGEIGAGLQLAPNALAVLDKLGVFESIKEYAVFPKRLVIKDALTDQELSTVRIDDEFRERYGYPYIVMHRSDLLTALYNACQANDRITLEANKAVGNIVEQSNGVEVTCSDGSVYKADAVVAADGLWSKSRQLFRDDAAVGSQYVAYRGTIPISEVPSDTNLDDVAVWIGPNLHFVQYPVRRKELLNQVAVFKSQSYREDSDDWGTPAELDQTFSICCEHVKNGIKFMWRNRRWPMYDREPIDNWTSERITLLGDAAHPMLQYLAQGACQAIEDAACLGDKLIAQSDYKAAFLAYQEERIPRTARVQRSARVWGDIWHTTDPIAKLMRNTLLLQREANDFIFIDWLYGHGITTKVSNLQQIR